MTQPTRRPYPVPPGENPVSVPYWEAARRHEFALQRCEPCGSHLFPPRPICPACGSTDLFWTEVSGDATIYTFTVARRATHPALADRVPYVIATIELAEGPRLTTNIVDCAPDDVHIGMPVTVTFEDGPDGTALPVFRPIHPGAHR